MNRSDQLMETEELGSELPRDRLDFLVRIQHNNHV